MIVSTKHKILNKLFPATLGYILRRGGGGLLLGLLNESEDLFGVTLVKCDTGTVDIDIKPYSKTVIYWYSLVPIIYK